ncbi:MAG: tRNA pseudouridine(38-40) synthase TruA [Phycisphaerae bacterium]|nr:tRNA pseudouridine(38-40) synthase TruA [Phycisphaerae bacterium]
MPRYKLTIAYDGTDFHGWQRQEPAGKAPLRTVQGVLNHAVQIAVGMPLSVVGASRTDSGVHAIGQVAAFTAETRIPIDRLGYAISARLPEDVQVTDASLAPDSFDPIRDAVSKCYRYTIAFPLTRPRHPPLFERRYVCWHIQPLDVALMQAAAQKLVGEHDFAAFAHALHGRESTVRRIHQCVVTSPSPGRVHIDVAGNGFLYNMVRIIAGTLAEVGRGRLTPNDVANALAARDRSLSGQTFPAQGLCLLWIHYAGKDVLSV